MFLKNTASQYIHAQMNSRTDGSPLTTSVSVAVKVDGGTQGAGGGTLTHIANGLWQYAPTQAETNGEVISFQFTHATGIDCNVEVVTADATITSRAPAATALTTATWTDPKAGYLDAAISSRSTYAGADTSGTTTLLSRVPGTVQPQTGDAYARLGAPAGASVSVDVAAVKADSGGLRTDYTTARAAKLDNLDVAVSTRNATAPPTVTAIRSEMDANSTKLANLDAAVSGIPAAVWGVTTRTLSSFGTLIADIWAYATRTLTAFGFNVTVGTNSDKTGYSLTAAYDAAKTAAQASDVPAANITAIKAKTDNLPAAPAAVSDVPTSAAIADKVLGRNLAGGSDGGRTVKEALRTLRNKVVVSGSTLTVYAEDDTTVAYTATIVTDAAAQPITSVDPA